MGMVLSVMDQLLALGNLSAAAGQVIRRNAGNTGWEFYTPSAGTVYVGGVGITVDGSTITNTLPFNLTAGTGISISGGSVTNSMTAGTGITVTGASVALSAGTQATLAAVAGKQDTITGTTVVGAGSITLAGLTANKLAMAGSAGLIQDSIITQTGVDTLSLGGTLTNVPSLVVSGTSSFTGAATFVNNTLNIGAGDIFLKSSGVTVFRGIIATSAFIDGGQSCFFQVGSSYANNYCMFTSEFGSKFSRLAFNIVGSIFSDAGFSRVPAPTALVQIQSSTEGTASTTSLLVKGSSVQTGLILDIQSSNGTSLISARTDGAFMVAAAPVITVQQSLNNKYFGGGGNQTATGTNNLGIGKGAFINLGTDSNVTMVLSVTQSSYANELLYAPVVIRGATASGTTAGQSIAVNASVNFGSAIVVAWSANASATGSKDVGISRLSAGALKINNGSTGDGDLRIGNSSVSRLIVSSNITFISDADTSPPADASTPVRWFMACDGAGNYYKIPGYQ